MFSSYDEKRPTQVGKHKDLPLPVWGVGEAGCAWPSRDVWEAEQGYMQQGKMTTESETLGWEVSLKQDRWQSQIQPKVPKTRMKLNRAEISSQFPPTKTSV